MQVNKRLASMTQDTVSCTALAWRVPNGDVLQLSEAVFRIDCG